ncbi:MAG TPA: hypothetical protein VN708_24030 [Terriglobales bacterium]|jgi:hypothetical protein|nr:hypothetical protein [Terriglobales bacterium]
MRAQAQRALLIATLMIATGSSAQVFRVQGGTSTMLDAQGGSVEFKAPNYDGSIGIGYYNGQVMFGGETRYKYHDYTFLAGDDSVRFDLPTDVFDHSHYFSARGAGFTRSEHDRSLYAFAGTTSTWLGTGFFNAATIDRPVAILFYQRKLKDNLRLFSHNIAGNRQTLLEGLDWSPEKWAHASVTGGIGSNQPYAAAALDAESQKLAFKTSYVVTGDMFRRVTVISPMSSEVNKGNVQMLYKPNQYISVTTGHENILQPVTVGGPMQAASIDQLSTDMHVDRFYFGTGLFRSHASVGNSRGTNFYVGRRIGRRFEVNTNYFNSQSANAISTTILSGTVRENLSSRFSLLQLISRTAGQTTYAFGGDYISNRLMVSVNYQNVYLPFRPSNPFQQALALNASFRVTGPMQITAASNVAPDGHLRYSIGMSTYLYRLRGMAMNANSPDSFSISKYVIQGVVLDDLSTPVEGAALRIGKQVVYTDSSGRFMLRFSKRASFPLSLAPEEFLTNGVYQVVSAPSEVHSESEDNAIDVRVIVRRVPPPQAKLYNQ